MTDHLLLKYISGDADPDENSEVKLWASGSEERKKALARLKNVWVLAGLENEIDIGKRDAEIERILNIIRELNMKEQRRSFRIKFMRYAAAILLLISFSGTVGYFISYLSFTSVSKFTEIIVPRGYRSTVMLPDGSKVQLNSDSHLKFVSSFFSDKRKVSLQGEAFFNVTPDKSRPFVVETKGLDIEVLGTSFNVSCYPNDSLITTFLQSGRVKINSGNSDDVFLGPSEAYFYNKDTHESSKVKIKDQRMCDWTKGILTVNGETIRELAKKLERRYNIHIIFGDSEVEDHIYTGSIKDENINTVLEALEFASSINYKQSGNSITLYSRKKKQPESVRSTSRFS